MRVIFKTMLLGGLIYKSGSCLLSDSVLYEHGADLATGVNMLVQAASLRLGLCLPYSSDVFLLALKYQYKMAVVATFATLILGLMSLRIKGLFAANLLKWLLLLTSLLTYFRVNLATGEIVALSQSEFLQLLHAIVIVVGLDMVHYDTGMRRRRHRRNLAEARWRAEVVQKFEEKRKE